MSPLPKIAIIGAGPGGLTLANILLRHSIPFTVYELDSSPTSRNQGGSLDLHPEGGQAALREAGLWEQFVARSRPESDVMKVVRLNGEVLWDGNGADKRKVSEEEKFDHRPEIDRAVLKEVLLAPLLERANQACIQWGKKLAKVVDSDGRASQHDLHFTDGTVEKSFDLVVGADGAWSKVRDLLTDIKPVYSGISGLELWALGVKEKHAWLSSYVGAGSCFSFGEGRAIQAQVSGDGSIRTLACLRKPEGFLKDCGIDWSKPDVASKEYVKRFYDDCGEDQKRILLDSNDQLVVREFHMLPVGMHWDSRPGLTLLGDAAHLMTPFAGVGVNVAMVDAMELGRAIVSSKTDADAESLDKAIETYEKELFPRGAKFAKKTVDNMEKHFIASGNDDLVRRLRAAFGPK